jgi:hypothetical protein
MEKPAALPYSPKRWLLRQQTGNIVGAIEPEVRQERIRPRSDPATIHPRSRGVCRRQARKRVAKLIVPRLTRATGSGGPDISLTVGY